LFANKKTDFTYYIKSNLHIIVLSLITVLSFTLNFYAINNYGYGNEYYSAAVLSMTKSFKNFFFVSFDPSGMLAIDKPPLGLWVQAIFVIILGFKGWVMILPQAISSSLCCILIYMLTVKFFSTKISLLASLTFAITPIIVAVSRNNTMDMQLIFILLLSVFTFFKCFEKNKKIYLFLTAILVGIGFNIKMFQAYLILPSFAIIYLFFYKEKLYKKFIDGFLACILMLVISLSWVTFVELYPKEDRPYIDSTSNNSIYELIFEHNGIERLIGESNIYSPSSYLEDDINSSNPNNDSIGEPSIFRLWNNNIYGQSSWLLILAFLSILTCNKKINLKHIKIKNIYFIFWEIYFLSMFIFFSFAGFYHRYYLCMIAPPISIISAIGLQKMFLDYKKNSSWKQYILPISIIITIINEFIYLIKDEDISLLLILIFISLSLASILLLFKEKTKEYILLICLCSILISPFYWAITPVMYVPNLTKPSAGPNLKNLYTLSTNINKKANSNNLNSSFALEEYLLSNYEKDSFLLVARKTADVSNLIISTGLPCYAYGGFLGKNNSLDIPKLKDLVDEGKITYFLLEEDDDSSIANYVRENARLIEESEYKSSFAQFSIKIETKKDALYSFKET